MKLDNFEVVREVNAHLDRLWITSAVVALDHACTVGGTDLRTIDPGETAALARTVARARLSCLRPLMAIEDFDAEIELQLRDGFAMTLLEAIRQPIICAELAAESEKQEEAFKERFNRWAAAIVFCLFVGMVLIAVGHGSVSLQRGTAPVDSFTGSPAVHAFALTHPGVMAFLGFLLLGGCAAILYGIEKFLESLISAIRDTAWKFVRRKKEREIFA